MSFAEEFLAVLVFFTFLNLLQVDAVTRVTLSDNLPLFMQK